MPQPPCRAENWEVLDALSERVDHMALNWEEVSRTNRCSFRMLEHTLVFLLMIIRFTIHRHPSSFCVLSSKEEIVRPRLCVYHFYVYFYISF